LNEPQDPKALARQRVILEVLAGRMNVTQAALELGVSRKTFYEWQDRALCAMLTALQDRPGGRPPKPVDPEKEQLQASLQVMEKDRLVLESRLRIQEAIRQTLNELQPAESQPKKKRAVRADDGDRGKREAGDDSAVRVGVQ
jgi:transposase